MFVIIETKHPTSCVSNNVLSSSRNTIVEVKEDGTNIEYQFNLMEEDDTNNTVQDDGINKLIHDTFSPLEDNFDDIHVVPLVEKEQQPLYEGSRTNTLSNILLVVKLRY